MGSTIDNVKNLADWFATESQSDDAGHSADVSQKSNTEIESVLSLGDLSLTTTNEYLWSGGSRVKDENDEYLIFKVSAKSSTYRSEYWQSAKEKKEVTAYNNLVDSINNWYSFDSSNYFKDNGYILDEFKVGNILPFGVAYATCEYEKISGERDNYFQYIPMPSYPKFIKDDTTHEINRAWGFGNINNGYIVQWAYINNDTHFGIVYKCDKKDKEGASYYDTVSFFNVYLVEKTNQVMNWLGKNYHTERGFIANDPIYGDGGVAQGLTGIVNTISDTINQNLVPSSVSASGFVNVYKIDNNELQNLGKDLFGDIDLDFEGMDDVEWAAMLTQWNEKFGELPEIEQQKAAELIADMFNKNIGLTQIFKLAKASVKNFFSSQLAKYVLDCHIVPVAPNTQAQHSRINIGYKEFSQHGYKCMSDYVDVSCGELDLKGYYQNFLDYSQTNVKLFLPFIGFVDLSPQYCIDGKIKIDYRFNILDGSCIAYIKSNKVGLNRLTNEFSVIAMYTGSACIHLPITGESYSQMVSGMMQTVGGTVSGIATANPMLAMGSIASGVSNSIGNASGTPSGNGSFSCSASFMGLRKPFVLIERPIAQLPPRFFKDKGGLAKIVDKLSKFNGFTKCTDVQMPNDMPKSISDNIKSLLESGVIL